MYNHQALIVFMFTLFLINIFATYMIALMIVNVIKKDREVEKPETDKKPERPEWPTSPELIEESEVLPSERKKKRGRIDCEV